MAVLWESCSPMLITVLMQSPDDSNWILLERWTIEAVNGYVMSTTNRRTTLRGTPLGQENLLVLKNKKMAECFKTIWLKKCCCNNRVLKK